MDDLIVGNRAALLGLNSRRVTKGTVIGRLQFKGLYSFISSNGVVSHAWNTQLKPIIRVYAVLGGKVE